MMDGTTPMLVVRAKPKPGVVAEFRAWMLRTHLAEARRIPGIRDVSAGVSAAGTWYALYVFEDAQSFERALNSPEAAYARGTWERWDDQMEERVIEVWAPLMPSPLAIRPN